ncbi:MAG TPA: alpha/beta hydrolase [Actinomycetes bacterium]
MPLDYARPGGRTTSVAISRLKATDSAVRIGPMIINLGGPAIPVLARVVDARQAMGETGARFDLVGMDARFTGRSTPLDCGWPASWSPRSAGATRRSFDRMVGLAQAAATGSAEPTPELDRALAGVLTGADSAFHSGQTAIQCADEAVPRDPEWYWRDLQARRAHHPLFGPLDRMISPCAFWPASPEQPPVRVHNDVPALIVNADGDVNATPELNQAMHRALSGSRLITLEGVRTHGVYLFQGAACVDDTVDAFDAITTDRPGILPAGDLTCARPGS